MEGTFSNGTLTLTRESGNLSISGFPTSSGTDITGGASTIVTANLTANRALISNASGKVAVSTVTSTELGYLDGVTGNIQDQIDKQLAVNQGSIINAIQSCCCNIRTEVAQSQNALQSQIAKCCCDTNLNVERTGNRIVDVLKDQNFQRASQFSAQTQLIQQAFCQQNEMLLAQFNDIKLREDAREIQALREKVQEQRDTANTQAILTAIENKTTTSA